MTEQPPTESNSGILSKWGEFCDLVKSKSFVEEKWSETHNTNDDYWERKSDKVTNFYDNSEVLLKEMDIVSQDSKKYIPKPQKSLKGSMITVNDINPPEQYKSSSLKLRQGLKEFRNNRNYQYAEKWEEQIDGTLSKKIVLDDGFG